MKNIKILLVDDEPDILEFIGYNLKKEGFEVETAQNGLEGLKQAKILSFVPLKSYKMYSKIETIIKEILNFENLKCC